MHLHDHSTKGQHIVNNFLQVKHQGEIAPAKPVREGKMETLDNYPNGKRPSALLKEIVLAHQARARLGMWSLSI